MSTTQSNGKKVMVGISGGVDSSVAACLGLAAGYEVEGLFMKNWDEDDGTEYCTAIADLEDAKRVCAILGITLHTANFAAEYWDHVFEDFLAEYRRGRTPNPDVLCNREIKFKQFAHYAQLLGADFIATGHYVRIRREETGTPVILKALDANKDQTYFLQAVPAHAFQNCLFPLGEWQKKDVREYARAKGLHNHSRKDSTGICFIGERRFDDFLNRYIPRTNGVTTDPQGRRLSGHSGLHNFTIGQRQGLDIGGRTGREERPWYVADKQPMLNRLIATQDQSRLSSRWLHAQSPNWLTATTLPLRCTAKIRYRQDDQPCRVSQAANGYLLVQFDQPQRAVAPGQFIAFYNGDIMLGGARIERRDLRAIDGIGQQTEEIRV